MADIDTALMQQVFGIPQRQWKPNMEHYHEPDDLGTRPGVLEWGSFRHPKTRRNRPALPKQSSSDNTNRLTVWKDRTCTPS